MSLKKFIVTTTRNDKFRVMFSAIVTNMFYIGAGCTFSYAAPAVPNINENRIAFHIDNQQQSWIGSLALLGFTIGGFVCGSVSDYYGRKVTTFFSAAFCIAGFTIVSSATNVQTLYAGILITGISSAINTTAVYLYTSEIATPDNRGILLSMFSTLNSIGMVTVFVAGSYLPWNWLAIFITALYAYPTFIFVFLPESPRWFLLTGNKEGTAHGLRWFRGEDANIDIEMEIIEQSLIGASKGISAFKDLLKWKHLKPLSICIILFFVQSFSGNFVVAVFAVTIFQLTNVDIDPNLQSVITALFSLTGSVFCLFLIERCGRRPLLIFSTILTVVGVSTVATFFQVQELNPEYATEYLFWLPMFGFSLTTFMYNIGLNAIPWVLACESFPTNIRGIVQTVCNVLATLSAFIATKTFTNVESALDTSGAFWFYAACGAAGILFNVFAVKEPKCQILD